MPTNHSSCEAALEKARAETRSAFENRALMYYYIFEELSEDLGVERATDLMKRAIFRRGLEVGAKYREAGRAGDLEAVAEAFCGGSPADGELFDPGVEKLEDGRLVLRMRACPLVDAWRKHGVPAEKIDTLCQIAAAVDEGTFEDAGLELAFDDRLGQPGSEQCLLELKVRE
jgi:hypothetical protein